MKPTLQELLETLPQTGRVEWIGLRPQQRAAIEVVQQVEASLDEGLVGDRYSGRNGKRQVTLIQHEHLAVIASLLDRQTISPADLRRNIAVSGINLLALKNKDFLIGGAILRHTGLCHPCSRMEETLGEGGYNALRGHGGITAQVISAGTIGSGDLVSVAVME